MSELSNLQEFAAGLMRHDETDNPSAITVLIDSFHSITGELVMQHEEHMARALGNLLYCAAVYAAVHELNLEEIAAEHLEHIKELMDARASAKAEIEAWLAEMGDSVDEMFVGEDATPTEDEVHTLEEFGLGVGEDGKLVDLTTNGDGELVSRTPNDDEDLLVDSDFDDDDDDYIAIDPDDDGWEDEDEGN